METSKLLGWGCVSNKVVVVGNSKVKGYPLGRKMALCVKRNSSLCVINGKSSLCSEEGN